MIAVVPLWCLRDVVIPTGLQEGAPATSWSLQEEGPEHRADHRPFTGQSSSDVVAAILEHEPEPLTFDPHVLPDLRRIATKALRKDRD
jgi:hypothetical protein